MDYAADKAVFSLADPCKVLAAFKAKTLTTAILKWCQGMSTYS